MLSNRHIHIACIDLKAQQVCDLAVFKPFTGDEAYCREVGQILEDFLDSNAIDRTRLLGIGIALPGIPNRDRHVVELSHAVNARTLDIDLLTKYIPYPCFLENDANAAAWQSGGTTAPTPLWSTSPSRRAWAARCCWTASTTWAITFTPASSDTCALCPAAARAAAAKKGCLEAYCSTARFSDDLGITREDFFSGLEAGNQEYKALWDDYLDHLAIGIYNIHIVLDCDIVMGGVLTQFIEPYLDDLRRRIRDISFFETDASYLRCSKYRKWTSCVGVALHFIAEFFGHHLTVSRPAGAPTV